MHSTMMNVPLSVNHLLERAGALFPDREIISRRPDRTLVRHTYREWHQRTLQLASALRAAGIGKGDRVATLCWNHHVHLECYFGIPACGAVMHTLNLRLTGQEIGWIAAHAEDRFLIIDDILLPLYRQFEHLHRFERVIVVPFSGEPVAAGGADDYEQFIAGQDAGAFEFLPHDENDPISLCYTSGTTGSPKGVAYSHRSTVLHALSASLTDHWGLRSQDVVMPVTPMFHANAWGVPYGAVMCGAGFVFPGPNLHADDLLDLITEAPSTLALGVPTIWMSLVQTYEASRDPGHPDHGRWKLPESMRSLVGGAAVPEALARACDAMGMHMLQGWGMTETSPLATVSYLPAALQDASHDERMRRTAMAGIPVPLVELRIRGEDGADAPRDGQSVGEIQVRGPYITGSYYGLPVTEDKFSEDGFLRTGDVGTQDAYGFVQITDRTKDVIKSGGEWISSVALENALMGHPAVLEAAVIPIPDAKWSERPLGCVVFKPGKTATPEQLHEHLLQHGFAKWQLPERYEVIAEIPRTSTGKFWKMKLREQFPH